MKLNAFTLAEVLVTLGIIGVVAALTMPTLIANYRKQVTETRLEHFYSMINQGLKQSELDNGPAEDWDKVQENVDGGNGPNEAIDWFNKYLSKYVKNVGTKPCSSGSLNNYQSGCVYFNNGSAVAIHDHVWFYYPNSSKVGKAGTCGKDYFAFFLVRDTGTPARIEPARTDEVNYSDNKLKNAYGYGCNKDNKHWCSGWYCTRLIQRNGWKIPKDYPYAF